MNAPRLRAPRDFIGRRTPTNAELDWAVGIVKALGEPFMAGLVAETGERRGRKGSVTARHMLIGWLLTTYEPSPTAAHTRVVENLMALSEDQRDAIGLPQLPPTRAYQRVWDKTDAVIKALDRGVPIGTGEMTLIADLDWFCEAIARLAIPGHLPTSRTRAVDGTDWETCGTLVSSHHEYDGCVPTDTDSDVEEHLDGVRRLREAMRKRKTVAFGPDGRPVYTKDVDARAGHRSANNRHNAGPYIGYELHLSTQVRDFAYGGKPDQIVLGQEVPGFVYMARLTPAGAHRLDAVVPGLLTERVPPAGEAWTPAAGGVPLRNVLWDRGYSILGYQRGKGALRRAGIDVVFDLSKRQRTIKAMYAGIDFIDGVPFSKHMPREFRHLPRFERDDTPEQRAAKVEAFDQRALWRYTPHGASRDGLSRRWMCPFCAGRLGIVDGTPHRKNVRIATGAPLVELPEGQACCEGTVTLPDDAVDLEQAAGMLWGTTAHATAYGQRALVENTNNLLHDKFVRLDRSYTKLMGLAKRKFVLAFLLAGVNRKIAEAWEAKEAAREDWVRRVAVYEAEQRGETRSAPSAAALRKRRSREALRARRDSGKAAPVGRRRGAARLPASRQ